MSRYEVVARPMQGVTAYILTDTARRAEAVLVPEYGNNCVEFRTTPEPDGKDAKGADCAPVDVFQPPAQWADLRDSPFHAGQPILFPLPNRVREGQVTFEGKEVSMAALLAKGWDSGAGQAIHGLVADKAWTVESAEADEEAAVVCASLQLDAFPDIFAQYPYPCRLTVTYRLADGVLEMHNEVVNTGAQTQPMGFGIHPWFPTELRPGKRLPETQGELSLEKRAKAEVRVPAASVWELEKLMPTGNVLPMNALPEHFDLREFGPLDGHFFDHVFTGVERDRDDWSRGGLRDPESGLEMVLAADSAFREWVLYAPETRPVIALEPYTCVTDAVNLHARGLDAGLITLPAGETWHGVITFGLRRSR